MPQVGADGVHGVALSRHVPAVADRTYYDHLYFGSYIYQQTTIHYTFDERGNVSESLYLNKV